MLGEEDLIPVGFIDDGQREEVIVESNGDVWTERGYLTSSL
jgi:hypothetical protein